MYGSEETFILIDEHRLAPGETNYLSFGNAYFAYLQPGFVHTKISPFINCSLFDL